jgi:hypothetical protein
VARTRPAPKPARGAAPRPEAKGARPRKPAAPARRAAPGRGAEKAASEALAPRLTDEETIEDAKYQPRDVAKRIFQEERFLFPESYGATRIRLLVKDPEWVFAHWDVDAKALAALRSELGERSMALTRLTLRIVDAEHGGGKTVLLPPGARSWYVRTDAHGPRSYRAELGVTLPSGDFRALAESNTVVPPRVGPSPERATVKRRFGRAAAAATRRGSRDAGVSAHAAPIAKAEAPAAPWRPTPERSDGGEALGAPGATAAPSPRPGAEGRGGASDVHRR